MMMADDQLQQYKQNLNAKDHILKESKVEIYITQQKATYNTGDSKVITHQGTNPAWYCLNFSDQMRTGAFSAVWP